MYRHTTGPCNTHPPIAGFRVCLRNRAIPGPLDDHRGLGYSPGRVVAKTVQMVGIGSVSRRIERIEERVRPKRESGVYTLEELCRDMWRHNEKWPRGSNSLRISSRKSARRPGRLVYEDDQQTTLQVPRASPLRAPSM